MAIAFHERYSAPTEQAAIAACLQNIASGGFYTRALCGLFRTGFGVPNLLLTPSCTHALELACHLLHLHQGDEVVLPSYNFPSAANAVLLAGGTPVLCDISPDTQNITAQTAANCFTPRTRAVIAVHYAGVACEMEPLLALCEQAGAALVEDAAQAVNAFYENKPLGTLGRFGAYSFHSTKSYTCGEGGALICGASDLPAAEIFREKGTNRTRYLRGECDRYTWQGVGSSAVLSEPAAALLFTQMQSAGEITAKRLALCAAYNALFEPLERRGALRRMFVPAYAQPNGHSYYVRFAGASLCERVRLALLEQEIDAKTHYVPLHLSPMGQGLGYGESDLPESRAAFETLLRLPLHTGLTLQDVEQVVQAVSRAVGGA